jgi:precorrin-2/cobalt-factor-2 C20-methyltransferase
MSIPSTRDSALASQSSGGHDGNGRRQGRLFGLGVGPGDPELITLKALRHLRESPVVAYFVAKGKKGNAFGIIESHLMPAQARLALVYPVTTEALAPPLCYETVIADFYDDAARQVAAHLDSGRDVAVICEGDPFFYGSYMYLHDRLGTRFDTEVVPGVCSMLGGAAMLGVPLVYRNQSLSVLSGVLPEEELERKLAGADAAVIMKLGRNFAKVRRVLDKLDLTQRAHYIERATMQTQRIVPIDEVDPMSSPYFSLLVVPGVKWGHAEANDEKRTQTDAPR